METVDDHILKFSTDFMKKAKKDDKPFFVWLNPTRMHVFTYLSPKVPGTADTGEWLVHAGSRHGTVRRRHWLGHERTGGHG